MPSNKCLFLDRDGVIIEDVHLLQKEEDIKFIDGIGSLIKLARSLNYKIVMITNQTVVARNLLTFIEATRLNQKVIEKLKAEESECDFDAVYICPHHPSATNPEFRTDCDCRKPRPGMLLAAAKELDIDLSKSFFVGDRISDIVAGNLAKCKTILLEGKNSNKPIIQSNMEIKSGEDHPDFKFKNLHKIKEILKQ